MKHQIEDSVRQFKDVFDLKATSPCAQNLWGLKYEAELLYGVKSDWFNLLTAKLLYIKKSKIPDIEPSVEFLITRVVNSNVEDWKKLREFAS